MSTLTRTRDQANRLLSGPREEITNTVSHALRSIAADYQIKAKRAQYAKNPVLWARERVNVDLWSLQSQVATSLVANKKTIVKSCHSSGKGVYAGEMIPTPAGWTTMGEIAVGDYVLDEAGEPTRVVGKSKEQTRPSYRITFDDGTEVDSWDEHQWQVNDLRTRPKGVSDWREHWDHRSSSTKTTEELFKLGVQTSIGQNRWRIPLAAPLQLPEADLPIDPYVLGLWLADGSSVSGSISTGPTKTGILPLIRAAGYEHGEPKTNARDRAATFTVYGLVTQLRELGLIRNKHIPGQYLRASEPQRRALLAGIMDGDGFLTQTRPDGTSASVGIDQTNKVLADGIYELLMTLGVKVSRTEGPAAYTLDGVRRVTGTRYRFNWRPLENPFRGRAAGWRDGQAHRSRSTCRTIVSIEPIEPITGYCIMVDSPRSLYLVGRSFVPTHNTFLGAVLACWWIDVHPPEETVLVSTAPTAYQVNKLLWEYIRKLHRNNGLSGSVSETAEWKSGDRDTVGMGRKPADTDMHGFQGVHRTYVLVIIDEACGVAQTIWTGVEAITTSETNRVLAIGNPDDPNTEFGRIFLHDDPSWTKFTISAFDTPRFTGEKVPEAVRQNLISKEWVEDKRISWGETSARYRAKVTAEFPENSDENLFPTSTLLKAQDLSVLPRQEVYGKFGVDVARFGNDKTTIVYNLDGMIEIVDAWEKLDTVESSTRVHALALKYGVKEVRVDSTGLGAGVQDQLARLSHGNYVVIGMVGSAASPDLRKWRNARAFWFDSLREKMTLGKVSLPNFQSGDSGIDAKDQDAKQLFEELEGLRYKYSSAGGAILIESKDEMRARGKKSPDYADALAYAVADFDIEDPLAGSQPGDLVSIDPLELLLNGGEGFVISPV